MLLEDEGGNTWVFILFIIGNVAMAGSGLFTITVGSYATSLAGHFQWQSGLFIMFGIALLLMAVAAFWSRKNADMLLLYILVTAVLLALQVAFTYAVIARDDYQEIMGIPAAQKVRYILIIWCVLIFLCLIVGWWYRASLMSVKSAQEEEEQMKSGLQKVTAATRAPLL